GIAWRRRYLTAVLVAFVAGGVLSMSAVAGTSKKGSVRRVAVTADSCGYPLAANTTDYPRGTTAFNESEVMAGFGNGSTTVATTSTTSVLGLVGDKIFAYYSDEHALTLGGTGADRSPNGGAPDLSPNFGTQQSDPPGP